MEKEKDLEARLTALEDEVEALGDKVEDIGAMDAVGEEENLANSEIEEISDGAEEISDSAEDAFDADNPFAIDFPEVEGPRRFDYTDALVDEKPESTELVISAEVPSEVADAIFDSDVQPTVEVKVQDTVAETPEISEDEEEKADDSLEESAPKTNVEHEENVIQDDVDIAGDKAMDEFEKRERIADEFRDSWQESLSEDVKDDINEIVNGWDGLNEASTAFKRSFKRGGEATADYIDGKSIARVKDEDERNRLIALKKLEKSGKLGDRDSVEKELARKEGQASVAYEKKADAAVKAGLRESQSQEISGEYKRLKDEFGVDVEDLVYGKGNFLYSVYPEEWNKAVGSRTGEEAPANGNKFDFDGDIIYSGKYWDEFVDWCKREKGIDLSRDDISESWTDQEFAERFEEARKAKR